MPLATHFSPRCAIEFLEARIAPATVLLANLDGADGFKLSGDADNDFAGRSVSGAGDVNGDGFGDVIVGADGGGGASDLGLAYLVFGKAGGFEANLNLQDLNGTNGFTLVGSVDLTGRSVHAAGDVNADGFDDLIIGAPNAGVLVGGTDRGAAFVVFGKAGSFRPNVALDSLDGIDGFRLVGEADGDAAGTSVAAAGDVNGDGFADVIIGAPNVNGTGTDRGAAYVVFGKPAGFLASVGLSTLNGLDGFKILGVADSDVAGSAVSGAGDVNGDGLADVIIGARGANETGNNRGAAYVVFGAQVSFSSPVSLLELSTLDGGNGFKLSGVADADGAGFSVSGGGDVNGDGFADVIIGANRADEGGSDRGAAYIVYGRGPGFGAAFPLAGLDGQNGFKISGEANADKSGQAVSAAGDVNGDGFGDVLFGVYGAEAGGTDRGRAFVIFGHATGRFDPAAIDTSFAEGEALELLGVANNDLAGSALGAAGDVNGDGFDDLIVGAFRADEGGTDRGAAYVVFGSGPKVTFSKDQKTAKLTEPDGDVITVKVSKGALERRDFFLGANGGLQVLELSDDGLEFAGANITISAKKPAGGAGDGLAEVGSIQARGVDLGTVKVSGSLGDIEAGDGNFATPGLKALNVGELFNASISGALGSLVVKGSITGGVNVIGGPKSGIGKVTIGGDLDGTEGGDLQGAIRASGNIGAVTIKGSLIGGGLLTGIHAGGKLGQVSIGGDVTGVRSAPVTITAQGILGAEKAADLIAIAGVSVKGDVTSARILAGFTTSLGAINPDGSIGRITVDGDWNSSDISAGVNDLTGDGFGQNDFPISGGRFPDPTSDRFATIASITIKGSVTPLLWPFHFGFTAQKILAFTIGGVKQPLTAGPDSFTLDARNQIHVVDFV